MPLFPFSTLDAAQSILGNGENIPPSSSGFGTRQSRVPDNRPGVIKRTMMRWVIPEQPIVEMYINPQNINYDYKKAIQSQRTKGGFIIQYWGEELPTLRISGTTGTSGIEGINVLHDVYRSEQLAFDPYALFLNSQQPQSSTENLFSNLGGFIDQQAGSSAGIGGAIGSAVGSLLSAGTDATSARPAPSLAQLACSVEMYWFGEVYRGFFNSFTLTESVDNLGMFNYDIGFSVTQKRGWRGNFLAWHKVPTHGPSDSSRHGPPHSYGELYHGSGLSTVQPDSPDSGIVNLLGF